MTSGWSQTEMERCEPTVHFSESVLCFWRLHFFVSEEIGNERRKTQEMAKITNASSQFQTRDVAFTWSASQSSREP